MCLQTMGAMFTGVGVAIVAAAIITYVIGIEDKPKKAQ